MIHIHRKRADERRKLLTSPVIEYAAFSSRWNPFLKFLCSKSAVPSNLASNKSIGGKMRRYRVKYYSDPGFVSASISFLKSSGEPYRIVGVQNNR